MSIILSMLLSIASHFTMPVSVGMTQAQVEQLLGYAGITSPSTLKGASTGAIYTSANVIVHYDAKHVVVAITRLKRVGE
jgi:hypothetical protein